MGYDLDKENIRWPFGQADQIVIATYASTMSATVSDRLTLLSLPELTGDATLNIVVSDNQQVGDMLVVRAKASTDGFDVTFGTNIDGPNMVGVATKTKVQNFIYDGSKFIATAAAIQID